MNLRMWQRFMYTFLIQANSLSNFYRWLLRELHCVPITGVATNIFDASKLPNFFAASIVYCLLALVIIWADKLQNNRANWKNQQQR